MRPEPVKAAAGAMAKMKAADLICIVSLLLLRMEDKYDEMRNDNGDQDWATAGNEMMMSVPASNGKLCDGCKDRMQASP